MPSEEIRVHIPLVDAETGDIITSYDAKGLILYRQNQQCIYCGDKVSLCNSWLWTKNPELLTNETVKEIDLKELEIVCYDCKEEYGEAEYAG